MISRLPVRGMRIRPMIITTLKPSEAIGDLRLSAPPTYYNHMHIICIIIGRPAVSLAGYCSLQVLRLVSPSETFLAIGDSRHVDNGLDGMDRLVLHGGPRGYRRDRQELG